MSFIYFDTSALVKRYVEEKGTEVVDELFDARRATEFLAISVLTAVELKSALRRLVKGGKIRETQYKDLISAFSKDIPSLSLILPVDNTLLEEAAATLEAHALRAGDAIHFASILRVKQIAENTEQPLIVVTSDFELGHACQESGLAVLDPEEDKAAERLRGMMKR
ncbi:MAG: type II toxin-antitoxin system VapC family toxin [Dehalococcoidia bacterium]|nr:type II toxin-antitoxin system VapC family toxin [Dehalococcoidia bacterium]